MLKIAEETTIVKNKNVIETPREETSRFYECLKKYQTQENFDLIFDSLTETDRINSVLAVVTPQKRQNRLITRKKIPSLSLFLQALLEHKSVQQGLNNPHFVKLKPKKYDK